MFSLTPSLDSGDASENLGKLLTAGINADSFQNAIRRLQNCFEIYSTTCPAPFIAPGLIVTPEIRRQCELYLPIAEITGIFNRLYRSALNYPPILSSTPFHNSMSWADTFVGLPPRLQISANPALLLEKLLTDQELLTEFLFASFLPSRFYGCFGRYPQQVQYVREWLGRQPKRPLRCLDAACGTGEDSYGLAKLLLEIGILAENLQVEGWTVEPLEVWSAAHCSFYRDRQRQALFREETCALFEKGHHSRIRFRCTDLGNPPNLPAAERFDLILCNGLLGGPIVNQSQELERLVGNLAGLLAPGGILLVADNFHEGWKQKCPQPLLRAFLEMSGLKTIQAGEGIGGLKPY